MGVLKTKAKLKALKWILVKVWQGDIQAQEVVEVFLFILEYRYGILSRGMQH
jgi:hypothetical protein